MNRDKIINNIKNYFIKNNIPVINFILETICNFNKDKSTGFLNLKEDFDLLYRGTEITSLELLKFKEISNKQEYDTNDYDIIINTFVYINYTSADDYTTTIKKLDSIKTYYSSYTNNLSIESFCSKKSCWFSEQEDQALLFQLERSALNSEPIMFEFNLKNNPNVINSSNILNSYIPSFFGIKNIENFLKEMGVEAAPDNLALENNKYILYICEAYNQYLQSNEYLSRNYELLKINGYCNKSDQNEIALTSFNTYVDCLTVKKYVFTKIVKNNVEFSIPLTREFTESRQQDQTENLISIYKQKVNGVFNPVRYKNLNLSAVHRMSCGDYSNIQIQYKNEVTGETKIFDCANKPEKYYWEKKYLKYKQKYLELKNKLK